MYCTKWKWCHKVWPTDWVSDSVTNFCNCCSCYSQLEILQLKFNQQYLDVCFEEDFSAPADIQIDKISAVTESRVPRDISKWWKREPVPRETGRKIAIYQLGLINNQIVWRVGGPACLHCGNNKKENNLRKQVKCFLNKTPRNGQFFF